ncbi:CinA family protein [Agromyces ramosus]|uniref:Nicotinamide-nucleotide amidase n=1 Tax=Agromyces ramosus TaxID=33879 RepID=A0ABU0R6V3_9MICO|nr:CinA family protein [Agromyces ramosus]MDQ0893804.1 nicotinamide-nucleotide amidase [Agromyces ramosus]
MEDPADEFATLAREVAERAQASGLQVAVAESLTSGGIANALGAAPEASEWFRGGVVAYAESVKRQVLGVQAEQVASAQCARELASGVARLLDADATVAVTGVGGPDPEGDEPAGSVYAAVSVRGHIRDSHFQFDADDPSVVVHQTVRAALELLRDALSAASDSSSTGEATA